MFKIERKIAATTGLLAAIACIAIMGSALAAQSSYISDNAKASTSDGVKCLCKGPAMSEFLGAKHDRGGNGGIGHIEVSEEYKQTVISIAESDEDVQDLLVDGYNVTSVHPLIKTTIDAEGYVTSRATTAVLTLQKYENNSALVWIDVANGAVTKIVVWSRTVIDKA